MSEKKISVFVDESGRFLHPDAISRFYIVGLVFHDQRIDIDDLVRRLDADWLRMGYEDFCFHAGPLIRKEKGYQYLSREKRTARLGSRVVFAQGVKPERFKLFQLADLICPFDSFRRRSPKAFA